jgi:hypothetical protein
MPKDETGRPIRQAQSAEEIFKFRSEQYLKTLNSKRGMKGKQVVQRRKGRKAEASGSGASPSTALAPLRALSLESSPSPADHSSECVSQAPNAPSPALADAQPTPSPSLARAQPKAPSLPLADSRPIQHLSPAETSQASDLQIITAKLSAVERGFEELKKQVNRLKEEVILSREEASLWRGSIERRLNNAGL